jgi:SAM-dependent methyltransferase
MTELDWGLSLLACPRCRAPLGLAPRGGADGYLEHQGGGCDERYPIIDGIPRLLLGPDRARVTAERSDWFQADAERRALRDRWHGEGIGGHEAVVSGFDYEWRRFSKAGGRELAAVSAQYFDLIPDPRFGSDQIVVDAGCGAGRWAYEVARRGARVVAVDLGMSVEIARRNTEATGRVLCVQGDVRHLPLRDGAVDWGYTLGVIHHIPETGEALARIARAIKPGGSVLVYVYYALDERGRGYRGLLRVADGARRVISHAPRGIAEGFSLLVALGVYWPLARLATLVSWVGLQRVAAAIPLSFYADLSFQVMRNDSLDRFGTRLEKRYTRAEVTELMQRAGLRDITISPRAPFWHAVGVMVGGTESF